MARLGVDLGSLAVGRAYAPGEAPGALERAVARFADLTASPGLLMAVVAVVAFAGVASAVSIRLRRRRRRRRVAEAAKAHARADLAALRRARMTQAEPVRRLHDGS